MKFIHRLGYYLVGFAIGLVFLGFFLKGKGASCDYSPNARVKKNIRLKAKIFSEQAQFFLVDNALDTMVVYDILNNGKVDFSNSKTNLDSCNRYSIIGNTTGKLITMEIENCPELAIIHTLSLH